MANYQNAKLVEDFFQIFLGSVNKTLTKNLDADVCKNIKYTFGSVEKDIDVEEIKGSNALYKLDFATEKRQGSLILLLPEEIIANVSDILTGGEGIDAYKGSLSEIETNSISKIMEQLFKSLEDDFKKYYDHDLIFSSDAEFILKEMPNFSIRTDNSPFDLMISTKLSLIDENQYSLGLLFNSSLFDNLLSDIGLSEGVSVQSKLKKTSLDVNSLSDIKINITAELGRTRVPIKYALELVRGSMVELDTVNNADIKVYANGVEFAYAQIVAVDEHFGLKITKIISPEERMEKV